LQVDCGWDLAGFAVDNNFHILLPLGHKGTPAQDAASRARIARSFTVAALMQPGRET
jgi:hypothetical protein